VVLVVEDDKAMLKIIISMLQRLDYNILAANSPSEAIRISESQISPIDIILTDVIMPQMNGKELVEFLKVKHDTVKVLYMSGYTDEIITERGLLEENAKFISKPFNKETLAAKLGELSSS